MTRRMISMRLDDELLLELDQFALSHGLTRTTLIELLGSALLDGRLCVVPKHPGDQVLPHHLKRGSSPLYPALISGDFPQPELEGTPKELLAAAFPASYKE